ncbi:MAG: Asp23/Gls24 family envelope stress response protein [Micrococcales bacterium]|nr:Asp23/Gls24 family envelope stress response protein [Micrococcales bacterium]
MTDEKAGTAPGVGGSGYSLDDLSAYSDRGRRPSIAAIDSNPECQAVLDSIERLGRLSRELVDESAATLPRPDESWIQALLESIAREVRAGADIPFPSGVEGTTVTMTEGAIREVVRTAGDTVPGVLVSRVHLEVAEDGTARVALSVSVAYARPLPAVAAQVREAVQEALARQSPIAAREIDVTVDDIHLPTARMERP